MKKVIFLLGLLVGVGLVASWAAGVLWWPLRSRAVATVPAASLTDEEKSYKDRLEFFGKRADDLERLLSLLLAGSTIYALAVGYNAYQQAKDAKEKLDDLKNTANEQIRRFLTESQNQSDKIVDLVKRSEAPIQALIANSNEQIKRMESQIARNFPLFRDMDLALSTITHSILHLLPTLDVVDGKFQQLSERQKQEILFYEKAMSTFEFFNTESLRGEISGMFHGLGNFYALKFKAAETQNKQPSPSNQPTSSQSQEANQQDLERARFYLDRAIREDSKNMAALNDQGYFALMFDSPADPEEARKSFLASLDAEDNQQRARYNLALIEHRAKNYQGSLEIIEAALQKKAWQKRSVAERIPDLWYNRACSLACLAGTKPEPEQTSLLQSALGDLERVATADKATWGEVYKAFEDDLKAKSAGADKDGDLVLLLKPEFAARIKSVRQKLASKATGA